MPRFELSATFSLATSLKALGMQAAFEAPTDSSGADLTGMSPRRELFIADVVHQAFVSVDEQGTEAAAATALFAEAVDRGPAGEVAPEPAVRLAIQDDRTSTVLFIGRLLDPGSGS